MNVRSNWVVRTAHGVALAVAGFGAALATAQSVLSEVADTQRLALIVTLFANAALVEFYITVRSVLGAATWHYVFAYAVYVLNEALFRSAALLNIGVTAAALYYVPERLWLMPFAALGVFAFVVSARFPIAESEWTERDVIRLYAQESRRYVRWLRFMQIIYAAVNTATLVVAVGLAIALLNVAAPVVFEAFVSDEPPTHDVLATSFWDGLASGKNILARFTLLAAILMMVALVGGLIEALWEWWRGEEPDTLLPWG